MANKLNLPSYESLLQSGEQARDNSAEKVVTIPIDQIKDFEGHPFHVSLDQDMLKLIDSIQENGYYCGPAILQMILSYHGINSAQSDLARQLNTSSITGTEYADMARVLNTYLFDCEIPAAHAPGHRVQELIPGSISKEDMQLLNERTITDISTGDPVPIAIDLGVLYTELPSANHFVLIVGYKTAEDGTISAYYVRDPYDKVQDQVWQGLKVFTVEELYNALNRNTEPAYIW